MTARDALGTHTREELGIEPGSYVNPWSAALSSLASFAIGALLPLLAMVLVPESVRIAVTFVAMLLALTLTGYLSARLGGGPVQRAVLRNVLGGAFAMAVTYAIGRVIGGALG
jgi:VIT1/CCC1 family predicted Fe2+/Mn2+ transporter